MRKTPLFSGLVVTCLLAGPTYGQRVLYTAVVGQANAEVRCKPGNTAAIYPTNRLPAGCPVQVVEEREDGWVGIMPPPGSFSYVNLRYVKTNYYNWMVDAPPQVKVPVYVGSALVNERPTVVGAQLERGAQVRSQWQVLDDGDGEKWLPIEPPAGEVRYIRAEALKRQTSPQPAVAAPAPPRSGELAKPAATVQAGPISQPASTFVPAPPAVAAAPAPMPSPSAATLWSQAYQAEREGRTAVAVELYNQLARDNATRDPQAANWAIERAAFLQNAGRKPAPQTVAAVPAVNNSSTYPPQTKLVPLQTKEDPAPVLPASRGGFANPPVADKPAVTLANRVESGDDKSPSAKLKTPSIESTPSGPSTANAPATPVSTRPVYSSGPGTLARAGIRIDGQPTYRLITSANNPTLYVTAVPGIDLERFVDDRVELIGQAEYRGDLRANHLLVEKVQPLATNP